MHDRPKRKPANDATVQAFFRSVYDTLSLKVLEDSAEDSPGLHADAESERIESANPAAIPHSVSKRRPRSSR